MLKVNVAKLTIGAFSPSLLSCNSSSEEFLATLKDDKICDADFIVWYKAWLAGTARQARLEQWGEVPTVLEKNLLVVAEENLCRYTASPFLFTYEQIAEEGDARYSSWHELFNRVLEQQEFFTERKETTARNIFAWVEAQE